MAFSVYVLASWRRVLYIGVTNDLGRRVAEHRNGSVPGFTAKYQVHRLVHAEAFEDVTQAIAREKELKGWRRSKKVALIQAGNPGWRELLTS